MLNLGEVVLRILVQDELANFAEGKLALGPNVGQVENVDFLLFPKVFCLLGCHGLHAEIPCRIVATLNGLEKILCGIVWGLSSRVGLSDELGTLLGLHVNLSIHPVSILVDQFQSMAGITVLVAVAVRDATITHEDHDLMDGLWILREVVPEHRRIIGVSKVGVRVALLRVNEVRELGWVAEEKHRSVVGHHVPITLFGSELDSEATRVSGTVVGTRLATNGRKSDADGTRLALLEHVGSTEIVQSIGRLVVAMSSGAFGVNDAFGNTFTVEM